MATKRMIITVPEKDERWLENYTGRDFSGI